MFKLGVDIEGFSYVDFDKKIIKRALKQEHPPIRRLAKNVIKRGAASNPGEFPKNQTGLMIKSIKSRVSKKGLAAIIGSYPIGRMTETKDGFYPIFLIKGTKRGVKKRKNFIEDAFNKRRDHAREAIRNAMFNALIPRK